MYNVILDDRLYELTKIQISTSLMILPCYLLSLQLLINNTISSLWGCKRKEEQSRGSGYTHSYVANVKTEIFEIRRILYEEKGFIRSFTLRISLHAFLTWFKYYYMSSLYIGNRKYTMQLYSIGNSSICIT